MTSANEADVSGNQWHEGGEKGLLSLGAGTRMGSDRGQGSDGNSSMEREKQWIVGNGTNIHSPGCCGRGNKGPGFIMDGGRQNQTGAKLLTRAVSSSVILILQYLRKLSRRRSRVFWISRHASCRLLTQLGNVKSLWAKATPISSLKRCSASWYRAVLDLYWSPSTWTWRCLLPASTSTWRVEPCPPIGDAKPKTAAEVCKGWVL